MHWMFAHAEATGQKEHDQAIHQGLATALPQMRSGRMETSTMDLIGPKMSWSHNKGDPQWHLPITEITWEEPLQWR